MHSFRSAFFLFIFVLVLAIVVALPKETSPPVGSDNLGISTSAALFGYSSSSQIAFVSRVIDGDTIEVEPIDSTTGDLGVKEKVRYLGMDTPETVDPQKPVECFGHEASARNKALVEGGYVLLRKDISDKDKYGRLLRFVYRLDGIFIDLELVKEGYAREFDIPPDTKYADAFAAAEQSARAARLGFWGACSSYPFTE